MLNSPADTVCVSGATDQLPQAPSLSEDVSDRWALFNAYAYGASFGIIMTQCDGEIIRVNPVACLLLERSNDVLIGENFFHFISEYTRGELEQLAKTRMFVSPMKPIHTFIKRSSGRSVSINLTMTAYEHAGESCCLYSLFDRTEFDEIKAIEEAHAQRFQAVSDNAPIGILQTNLQWEAVYVNARWAQICGRDEEAVLNKGWIKSFYIEDVKLALESLRSAISRGEEFACQVRLRTPLGDIVWVEFKACPIFSLKSVLQGFIATIVDCTYRYAAEQRLRALAERDALTGLANRVLFQDRLKEAVKRVERRGMMALLCLDLDGFKNVNDSLGHDAGDALLVSVAKRMVRCVREVDTVARMGGDEFMVIMENIHGSSEQDTTTVSRVAEKILRSLRSSFFIGNKQVYISASIGIALSLGGRQTDDAQLIKQADIALYRAKHDGRNNYQYYTPELEKASRERHSLGSRLRHALEQREFELYYQLQADTQSHEITGCEALLRWQHPERGLLGPETFISIIEECSFMAQVSYWIWEQAFSDLVAWQKAGLVSDAFRLSVNVTAYELRDPSFFSHFERAIHSAGVKGESVTIEITESALLQHSVQTQSLLKRLRALGVSISLDDFGTGYASLTNLKRFSIDCLKIDQSFVRGLLLDAEDATITDAVIGLAQALNLKVVAEGVEVLSQLDKLARWGCDYFQGYLLNKPCSEQQVNQLLQRSHIAELNGGVIG